MAGSPALGGNRRLGPALWGMGTLQAPLSTMEAPVYLLCTQQEMPIGHQLFGVKLAELPQCPSPLTIH